MITPKPEKCFKKLAMLNGWINRDGKAWLCGFEQHTILAERILKETKTPNAEEEGWTLDAEITLERLSYVKIRTFHHSPEITKFHPYYRGEPDKENLSQAQINTISKLCESHNVKLPDFLKP